MKHISAFTDEFGRSRGREPDHRESMRVRTEFSRLDEFLEFYPPGKMGLIAARPSMGKTTLARTLVSDILNKTNIPVLYYSLEAGAMKLVKWFTEHQESSHQRVPLYIDDNSFDLEDLVGNMMDRAEMLNGGVIVVDYLQLIAYSGTGVVSRQEEIEKITGRIRTITGDVQCYTLVLSQLTRRVEQRDPPEPEIEDVQHQVPTGAFDQVMTLYRPSFYNGDTNKTESEMRIRFWKGDQKVGTTSLWFDEER